MVVVVFFFAFFFPPPPDPSGMRASGFGGMMREMLTKVAFLYSVFCAKEGVVF